MKRATHICPDCAGALMRLPRNAGRGMIWILHRASLARNFDRVLVMSGGKLQEQGRFEELDRKDSLTALLMAAE